MSLSRITLLLSLAVTALSKQPPIPIPPYNSQLGAFRFPLSCKLLGSTVSLDGIYYGLGPVVSAPGQPIYFTDVTSSITIPETLTHAGSLLNASYASSKVFVDLDFSNALPSTLALFPEGRVINATLGTGNDSTIVSTGVLPPIGPITTGDVGVPTVFYLGQIIAEVTLYDATDKNVFGPYNLTCPPLDARPQLGTVNIAGLPNATVAEPSLPYQPELAHIKSNQEVGYYSTSLFCDIGKFMGVALDVVLGGKLYSSYASGSQFRLTAIRAQVHIPQTFLDDLVEQYGAEDLVTTLDSIQVDLTNASPPNKNVLKSPLIIKQSIPETGGLTFDIPTNRSLHTGNFTAGPEVGDFMYLSLADAKGKLSLQNGSGILADLTVHCSPPVSPFLLYGILIDPPSNGTSV